MHGADGAVGCNGQAGGFDVAVGPVKKCVPTGLASTQWTAPGGDDGAKAGWLGVYGCLQDDARVPGDEVGYWFVAAQRAVAVAGVSLFVGNAVGAQPICVRHLSGSE